MRLVHLRKLETATTLIQRGMRVSIVHSATGVNQKALRSLHREIHGKSAVAGLMPSTGGILSTRLMHAMASVFSALYHSIGGPEIFSEIQLNALVSAHDLHIEICQDLFELSPKVSPLNITQAWIIARDLRIRSAHFHRCNRCNIDYLLADDTCLPPTCPVCSLKKRKPGC